MDTSHYNELGPGDNRQFEEFSRTLINEVKWTRQILVGILLTVIVDLII